MHRLCHLLNEMGEEAYITSQETNPDWNTPYYDGSGYDKENTVVIYPECIPDNKLDAKHVVRWLLYHQVAEYNPTDYVFKLFNYYHSINNRCDGYLKVLDYKVDQWRDLNLDRTHNMIAFRKGKWKKDFVQIDINDIIIYDEIEKEEDESILSEMMNKCSRFICFDDSSFIPVQAALCGCESIVIPDPNLNAEQWRSIYPAMKYGIAYGNSQYELDRAKFTKNLVRWNIEKINKNCSESVKEFVEFWKDKLQ